MTAYGAVNSLRNTTDYILNSSHFTLVDPSPHFLQLAYQKLNPLQEILEKLDRTSKSKSRKKVNALDGRIKELIWEFEDLLESLLYQQILSQLGADQVYDEMKERIWDSPSDHTSTPSRRRRLLHYFKAKGRKFNAPSLEDEDEVGGERMRFSIDLQFLQHHVPSFMKRLKDMEEGYIYEVDNMPEDEDDGDQSISSRSGIKSKFIGSSDQFQELKGDTMAPWDFIKSIVSSKNGTKSKMIGLSDQFQELKKDIMSPSDYIKRYTALVGTAGVGKTALAEAVFEDPEIMMRFEHRVWVRVGRKSQFEDVSRAILAEMFGNTQGDVELSASLRERLQGKKCLIVLDDVWEAQILDSLSIFLQSILSSVRILVTTRGRHVIRMIFNSTSILLVRFLNEKESKELLCEKVFGEEECPYQLDKAATKIAKKCEGLPLMIVTVADIISKAENNRDPKYWDDVAEMRNSVFTDAYNEISKVLFPSYDYLPQYLKMPFLYMGVFPLDYDIPRSKLRNMLATEGWFHNTNKEQPLEVFLRECLSDLCTNRNLVLFNESSSFYKLWIYVYGPKFKTFCLHSSWRHVCRGEAQKNKFYHVLNKLVEGLEDGVKGQRCLCLENNILFSIKDFCDSVRLNCESHTHSLLFFGPYHQYPIPVGNDFKLLGKLDALNLRLYTFPTEILTLVLLKYLALTCNGELPPTISKLFNLQVLIIHPHNIIRICGAPSYVPTQIWDMKELEYIEILGTSLVAPRHFASLEKTSTLIGVNANICTISELSKKVPSVRKLGVQIELTPYDDHNDLLGCFGCISTLGSLEILKCGIINPVFKYDYVRRSSLMTFPSGLRKLHLSGMGFPWKYMDVIGSLPNLRVLKLRAYAFRGSKWEVREGRFPDLRFLLIEDSDLVQWKPRARSFPNIVRLSMKHCYKLREIHWPSRSEMGTIELENCNPVAVTCAKQLQPNPRCIVDVTATSSFDVKPITIKFTRFGPSSEPESETERIWRKVTNFVKDF